MTVFSLGPGIVGPDPLGGTCRILGLSRNGNFSMVGGAISRIDVSRDGSEVVFEVMDDFSLLSRHQVPPEQEGIYLVRADGSGLRRLGPASRDSSFRIVPEPRLPVAFIATIDPRLPFSPDGRRIIFTDRGAGRGGDAVQIVTLELETGRRTQITHLPPVVPPTDWLRHGYARFTDHDTVSFATYADADMRTWC